MLTVAHRCAADVTEVISVTVSVRRAMVSLLTKIALAVTVLIYMSVTVTLCIAPAK